MIKKNAIKRIILSTTALIILGLFCLKPAENINLHQEEIYISKKELPIFAIDKNGYVAKNSILINNEDLIPYIISTLTINSENSIFLPDNFLGVIPQNTKLISYYKNNGILELNFSKELLNVSLENEEKLIESLIYSLCNIKNIKGIKIFVDNNKLEKLPVSHKILPDILDKSYGINKTYNINSITNLQTITVYYLGKDNNDYYYIPITKIMNSKLEPVEIVINELKKSPIYESNLISFLNASYELKDYEIKEDTMQIFFDKALLMDINDNELIEKVKYSLVMSLKDTYNIDNVDVVLN